jgi:hypothetical protein
MDHQLTKGEQISCDKVHFTTSDGITKSYTCSMAAEATEAAFDFFLNISPLRPLHETWSQCDRCHVWCWRQDIDLPSEDQKAKTASQERFTCSLLERPCHMAQVAPDEVIDDLLGIVDSEDMERDPDTKLLIIEQRECSGLRTKVEKPVRLSCHTEDRHEPPHKRAKTASTIIKTRKPVEKPLILKFSQRASLSDLDIEWSAQLLISLKSDQSRDDTAACPPDAFEAIEPPTLVLPRAPAAVFKTDVREHAKQTASYQMLPPKMRYKKKSFL